jgi:hypothetical protein
MSGSINHTVVGLLERIVHGNQFGAGIARQLESAIIERYPNADDDEWFGQLMLVLASYRPQGGQYMYDQAALVEECRRVLSLLKAE